MDTKNSQVTSSTLASYSQESKTEASEGDYTGLSGTRLDRLRLHFSFQLKGAGNLFLAFLLFTNVISFSVFL